METRVYEITEKNGKERPPTDDIRLAKAALRRGAEVNEVKSFKSYGGIPRVEITVTTQLFLNHFVDQE